MDLLIAGGSGFIGRQLAESFTNEHRVTVLGRDEHRLKNLFPSTIATVSWDKLPTLDPREFDAVINLCGRNIAASRWNDHIKQEIITSRVDTTASLIDWIRQKEARPHFYCANAIGIYGIQSKDDPQAYDEDSSIDYEQPKDFLSEICIRWEQALQPARDLDLPVTVTRFGVVLKKDEGMLRKLTPAFKLGLGSVMGDGRQIISWIHYKDLIAAWRFLLHKPQLIGAFNLTSPNPVNQAEFARTMAQTMNRPLFLKTPAWFIRLLFGEMGDALILNGQRVKPKRLPDEGFEFQYSELSEAMAEEFGA
ncbi:TIGR01777 family oxidoreductase [Legionella spiritensis]|uniref:Nucleoside-diphosphate sugar epimerase n=1 Tax=Legionella spiritensis TaxID=452 RepID=A0A0W0ZAK3_LEGSP|nr:TIGR01777 family oxidoreductase [Legionella spiritensis]KTD66145.1 nucleoside-diphosphate sugar epimerase [Legionella spiritensis]SNV43947.1 nucleoside-diphosphate sugar epimerase [Legionella spiritensis]